MTRRPVNHGVSDSSTDGITTHSKLKPLCPDFIWGNMKIYHGTCLMTPGKSYRKQTNLIISLAGSLQNHVCSICSERLPVLKDHVIIQWSFYTGFTLFEFSIIFHGLGGTWNSSSSKTINPFMLRSQYHRRWSPGSARSQGISSHVVVLVFLEYYRLTHCDIVTLCGVIDLGQHWFRCLMAPSHYLNQCWLISEHQSTYKWCANYHSEGITKELVLENQHIWVVICSGMSNLFEVVPWNFFLYQVWKL